MPGSQSSAFAAMTVTRLGDELRAPFLSAPSKTAAAAAMETTSFHLQQKTGAVDPNKVTLVRTELCLAQLGAS